jgi:predicted O-methyltransferase YrrM
VLPRLFSQRPDLTFDLITVDGDHSPRGAARDLQDVLPRLRIGGVLVFDDISHPQHPKLLEIWRRVVVAERRYSTWHFDDVGYGVAVAVRRW